MSYLNSDFTGFKTPSTFAPRSARKRNSTPSTTTPGSTRTGRSTIRSLAASPQNVLALCEGRGHARGDVGIACIGVGSPKLVLCQVTDSQNYAKTIAKINIFEPVAILMVATNCPLTGQSSQLYRQLQKTFKNIQIVPLKRNIFSDAAGMKRIKNLVNDHFSSVFVTISQKYYALAATAALFKYMEIVHTVIFSPRTLKIEFQGPENTMLIDSATAHHLELLENIHTPNSAKSLLGILNNCRTPMGSRLLRMNILQPSCRTDFITQRLDCVQELTEDAEFLYGLRDVLSRFSTDLDQVISGLILIPKSGSEKFVEQRINFIIGLKHVLELLPSFAQILNSGKHSYFQHLCKEFQLPVFTQLMESISKVINDEAHVQQGVSNMQLQRTFAVIAEVNPLLDITRKVYCELIDDVNKYVVELSKDNGIAFRLCKTVNRGFHLQFTLHRKDITPTPVLPNTFLQVHRSRNVISFTTDFLLMIDRRVAEILREIQNISAIVIGKLITLIREDISSLYQISEAVSNLDVLHSFAAYALETSSVRPQFSSTITSITNGRHPILSHSAPNPPVPNNTFISNDASFMLITGPNMSGKTTYLKQVATLQILAQIGSFVPANATFRIIDCIFSRVGTCDSLEESASTFEMELSEMNYILKNISRNSLVIIDELGRATSVEEGTAISWAMAESFLNTSAFVLFATHYLFLTKLESVYYNVLNFKMDTVETNTSDTRPSRENTSKNCCRLQYTHILRKGVTEVELYGLKLVRNSSYPSKVIDRATVFANSIIQSRQKHPNNHQGGNEPSKIDYLLACQIILIYQFARNASPLQLSNYMKELHREMKKFQVLQLSSCSKILVPLSEILGTALD